MKEVNVDTQLLRGRYEIIGELGKGAQGVTLLGLDRQTGAKVAIKRMRLRDLEDWKALELFEREGRALAALEHPRIPAYIDAFHDEANGGSTLHLVQQHVDGESLGDALARGRRFTEDKALDIARQLLGILAYLHTLEPPMVHRDIKPSNLILDATGQVWLVDFGGVQTLLPSETGGSTVVGTSGYMPPEQLMGRASPASDLYAVGATLAHILSHVHPSDMELEKMRLRYQPHVDISARTHRLLDALLDPHVEERPADARQALALLDAPHPGKAPSGRSGSLPEPKQRAGLLGTLDQIADVARTMQQNRLAWQTPLHEGGTPELSPASAITVERAPNTLTMKIPRGGIKGAPTIVFAMIWNGMLALFTLGVIFGFSDSVGAMIMALMFLSLFWAVGLFIGYSGVRSAFTERELRFEGDTLTVHERLLGMHSSRTIQRAEVEHVDFHTPMSSNGQPIWEIEIATHTQPIRVLRSAPRSDQLYVACTTRDWYQGKLWGDSEEVVFDHAGSTTAEASEQVEANERLSW